MGLRASHHVELPEGVILSVQGVSRAAPRPEPEAPAWLKRVLPKSGLAGSLGPDRYVDEEEDNPDDDEDEFGDEVSSPLNELSFEVAAGQGVGIVGPAKKATLTLLRILSGSLPPTTGRVVARGRIAALSKAEMNKLFSNTYGEPVVFLACHFLGWPRSLIRSRWAEILEFARLEELEPLDPRQHRNKTKMRLLFSAALHMDASVYVVDQSLPSDASFAERCFDLLAQRQQEGAVVVQRATTRVEEVARLCSEVLWLEDGEVKFRGRPLEVAVEAEKAHKEELHPLSAPVLASLANGGELVQISGSGGRVEVDLEVLRRQLELGLTLELTDHHGVHRQLEQPDNFVSEGAGLHRLRISIPGGLVPDGMYDARLMVEIAVPGAAPAPPRELLAFEIAADGYEEAEADDEDVLFTILQEPVDEDPSTENQVEWNVGRTPA
jgi:ABC-type polysaccharide/polyol phosphate transport system ATPase subunit